VILLISASWVAKITEVNNQHPASSDYLKPWIIPNLTCGILPLYNYASPVLCSGLLRYGLLSYLPGSHPNMISWSLSRITRIIGMSHHCHSILVFETESYCEAQAIIERTTWLRHLKLMILLSQLPEGCDDQPLAPYQFWSKFWYYFVTHPLLHSFWCLLRVLSFELRFILSRLVLCHLSQVPCPPPGHPEIFFSSPLSVAY
jgi:hypothetical protein